MGSAYTCPVCRDTGIVWSPDPDGESLYESACPEGIHDEGDDMESPRYVHHVRDPKGDEAAHS